MRSIDRISELFEAAVAGGEGARERVMQEAEEAGVREELEKLLRADVRNEDGFLTEPLIDGVPARGGEDREIAAGAEVGGGRIIGVLSRGANADVYLAEHEATGRKVAVKVLRSGSAREILVRFEQERKIAAILNHEHIAAMYDAGATEDGRAYFVMEYVEGKPITEFCEARGLAVRARLGLFLQLCTAVEHAHQHGIIHRDLKPSNILVSEHGRPTVKVIDFGIARSMGRESGQTAQGQVLGTIGYMAPEQIRGGEGPADTRSDTYALGAVLYELMTGEPAVPTEGAGPLTIVSRIATEAPEKPSRIRARLRGDLEWIILKALEKEAGRRYQTVEALRTDLERFLAGRPVTARRPSPAYVVRRWVGRHKGVAAAMALLMVVAGGAAYRRQATEDAKFDLSVSMADSWFDYSSTMAKTVGERRHRGPLLAQLDAQSASLLEQAPRHSGVMEFRADVVGACGDLDQESGHLERARARFNEVLELRRRLVRREPRSLRFQADLSVALVRVGDVAKDVGDLETMREMYGEAMAIDEALAASQPRSARAVTLLAWSCDRLGELADGAGDHATGRAYMERKLSLFRTLVTIEESADARRGLSKACLHASERCRRDGDLAGQMRFIRESLAQAARAVQNSPGDWLALWNQMIVLQAYFDGAGDQLGVGELRRVAEQIVTVAQRMSDRDSEDEAVRDYLLTALMRAAECAERDGDAESAAEFRADEARERSRRRPGGRPRVHHGPIGL